MKCNFCGSTNVVEYLLYFEDGTTHYRCRDCGYIVRSEYGRKANRKGWKWVIRELILKGIFFLIFSFFVTSVTLAGMWLPMRLFRGKVPDKCGLCAYFEYREGRK